jgi:3-oxoadipate enol-lactonase
VIELYHEESGEGPPLLLSGSLGSTLAMWDPLVPAIRLRHRVIRYDHRGHGRSSVPRGPYSIADLGRDAIDLMDRLGIARASFCGVSLGGMTGMWLAANAPERVDRLVLLCTSAHLPPASAWEDRASTVRAARSTAPVANAVLDRWITAPFANANPDLEKELRGMLLSIDPEGYAASCTAIERMDLRGELRRIEASTLVVVGEHDRATPPEHGRAISAAVRDSRAEAVAGAHLAAVECVAEIAGLILDHLREEP